jgi:Na+/H+-dicarboxylate symporter
MQLRAMYQQHSLLIVAILTAVGGAGCGGGVLLLKLGSRKNS